MPIYEWKCPSCGRVIERILIWGKWPSIDCPSCGTPMEREQFAITGKPQFLGEGWASDGYSKKETT